MQRIFAFSAGVDAPPAPSALPGRTRGPTDWSLSSSSRQDADWYSFTLDAGETATVALTEFSGEIQLDLYDSAGTLLAIGLPEATNVGDVLSTFTAIAAGTYYAKVNGAPGTRYSLVVTRNADFDIEGNDGRDSAQVLIVPQTAGRRWVMGHLGEELGTVTVSAIDSGWWNSDGTHNPNNQNYFAGWGGCESFATSSCSTCSR